MPKIKSEVEFLRQMFAHQKGSSQIRYYIDEEKRTIVAVLENCQNDALTILKKAGLFNMCDGYELAKISTISNSYRGKAKCAEEDKWSEDYGMTLARNRLLEKYYCALSLALMRAENFIENSLRKLSSRIDEADFRYETARRNRL